MISKGTEQAINALIELDEARTISLVEQRLGEDTPAIEILNALQSAMGVVGERFSKGEYFLAELIMAAEIFSQAMERIKPTLTSGSVETLGKIVFATVKGDVHDLGKNIVVAMLQGNGFEVYDLGVDVPVDTIIDKVKETGATVIGLSALLTTTYPYMKDVITGLEQSGLRDNVKVMIGGGPVDERVRQFTGADAHGRDAIEAVALARQFMEAQR
jgi:5-methyltetrahydrofolate--homocysteine methyltransferase